MKKFRTTLLLSLLVNLLLPVLASSQCMMVPVSLNERVTNSDMIVEAVIEEKETFLDSSVMQVYTMNKLLVKAWLKNRQKTTYVYVRTEGGIYQNHSTVVNPSLQLQLKKNYVLFLQKQAPGKENRFIRLRNTAVPQTTPVAGAQGGIEEWMGMFTDVMHKQKQTEAELLGRIKQITKQEIRTPEGRLYIPKTEGELSSRIMAITGISPSTTKAGTIDAADQITITGSGFGAAPGAVYFSNADNGGASFVTSGLASDIISWSDNSITVKVFTDAGTGPVNVNGTFTSPSNLTVQYAHLSIEHDFFGFAQPTRQRYYLRNLNGTGGYTFQFNTAFAANVPAVTAFTNAVDTWRNGTAVNFSASGTTTVNTSANDGVNAVYFSSSIPLGTLAICTSNFNASATGACMQENTVWWLSDMDIQFRDVPTGSTTWEYGPAAPSASEYDFQSVALHELGHAHGLGHVIASGQVMHYAIANGATARTLSPNDVAAGVAKVGYSDDPTCFNPPASGTEMIPATTSLPVTLGELKARRISKTAVQLNWNTLQESNNKGFFVERGETARELKRIDFVAGQGQSSLPVLYNYTDAAAGPYAWYYRISQQDYDGRVVSSAVLYIKGDETKAWRIWTNESGDLLQVYIQQPINKQLQLQLFTSTGQLAFTTTISNNRTIIPVQQLKKGFYSYRLIDGNEIISGKLIIGK
ncbi:MAG: matrixin family metalloprotease [Lacibacter sp.]